MYIYKITNLLNQKVYIGQSSKNWEESLEYYGSGVLIEKAIKSHGLDNFEKELLENCKTKKQLDKSEKFWIKHYKENLGVILYNLTEGGTGGLTYKKGSELYEQIKHKLGVKGSLNAGSRPEIIEKRVKTWMENIDNGQLPLTGKTHGNYKGKLEQKNSTFKGNGPSINAVRIEVDGIEYRSYKEASRALGIAGETISRRCHLEKFKNYKIIE